MIRLLITLRTSLPVEVAPWLDWRWQPRLRGLTGPSPAARKGWGACQRPLLWGLVYWRCREDSLIPDTSVPTCRSSFRMAAPAVTKMHLLAFCPTAEPVQGLNMNPNSSCPAASGRSPCCSLPACHGHAGPGSEPAETWKVAVRAAPGWIPTPPGFPAPGRVSAQPLRPSNPSIFPVLPEMWIPEPATEFWTVGLSFSPVELSPQPVVLALPMLCHTQSPSQEANMPLVIFPWNHVGIWV